MTQNLVYIANSGAEPIGITVAALDDETGSLSVVQQVTEISECHYLNLHPNGRYLYATTMDGAIEVVAFAIEATGALRKLNSQPAAGTSPCYVCVDASGGNALLVNYVNAGASGNVRVYPIGEDGLLRPHSEMIEHDDACGPNAERQDASHPHMIVTTPDNYHAVVPDLGTDKVYLYALDSAAGRLALAQTLELPPGAGPRHVAFHPDSPRMYVINELDSTLATFAFDEADSWALLSIESTLPPGHIQPPDRPNFCADVHVHPTGRFLYGSNRGHDSLVIFALDADGVPALVGHQSTLGQWPRAFMIDSSGEFLVVGNRHTDDAVVFAIDSQTGLLTKRSQLAICAPIAFKMAG
ncbi:MAG: lactonase family protein [Chloroflexi bacterium]|nr:lactonase family protein [Chloroflexota bacterium]MCY4248664.1 lactonase family protein [Chloroflexota bacterium]